MKYDVQKIVDEILDGSTEWSEKLPELLKDEEFRKEYLSLMIDESLLSEAVAVEAGRRNFDKKPKKKPVLITGVILAAAASLIISFILLQMNNYTAKVISAGSGFAEGDRLKAGYSINIPDENKMVLQFKDKSKLTLFGPLAGVLEENGISLKNGYLSAEIKPRSQNKFLIKTAHSTITVLGTVFNVSAMTNSTELTVDKGKVKIMKENETLEVLPEQFVMASSSLPFKVFNQDDENLPEEILKERKLHIVNRSKEIHLLPEADSYTGSGANRHKNFGDAELLRISRLERSQTLALLRFDLSDIEDVSSAKLRLYSQSASEGIGPVSLKLVNDDTWLETRVKFSNGPKLSDADSLIEWQPAEGRYSELDVTAAVRKELAGDKIISFSIRADSRVNTSIVEIPSKENPDPDLRPMLIIKKK